MRLAFMGSPDFSVPALHALRDAGHEIAVVYCQPPRPAGRGQSVRRCPVHVAADALGLEVRVPERLRKHDDVLASFADLGLDATTAIRLFFTKVAKTRSIPFQLKATPEFSPEAEARILQAWEESKDPANLSKPYTDVAEMMRDIDREIEADGKSN
jgi:addiction module RelB/DinJ family antitoxin